jgi:hypothetical protein
VCASAHSPRFMFFPVLENPMIETPGCPAAFVLRTGFLKLKATETYSRWLVRNRRSAFFV